MKLYIKQFNNAPNYPDFNGKFYITERESFNARYNSHNDKYLHADGSLHTSTVNEKGQYFGYFECISEAIQCCNEFGFEFEVKVNV